MSLSTVASSRTHQLSLLGTILEYYDYALYGFCAGLLADKFFPHLDPEWALVQTYLIFCSGSLAKPLGSLIFGWIGDMLGRRVALRWSMMGIVIPTIFITVIPETLSSKIAMIMILMSRMVQGIFIAGESDGVRIRLFEAGQTPYLMNATAGISSYLGIYLASHASYIAKYYPDFWRWPFIIGGICGLGLFYVRQFITESPDFIPAPKKLGHPNYLGLITTVFLCGAVGGSYHLFFVYQPTYWSKILGIMSDQEAQNLINHCLLIYIPCLGLSALAAERFGGRRVILAGIFGSLLLVPFLSSSLLILSMLSITLATIHSPGFVLLMQLFPSTSRYRHISFGHSLGSLLFSGSAPLVASFFWQTWHSEALLIYHFIALFSLSLIAMILLKNQIEKKERFS